METKTNLQLKGAALSLIALGLLGQLAVNANEKEHFMRMERKTRKKLFLGVSLLGAVIMGITLIAKKK